MLVQDIVRFNRDNYYNGAIQTEWFYDPDRVEGIAKSYVFHGPKYYGVTNKDVAPGGHKLLDTASFARILSDKLANKANNNFVLTIAGYGAGKSHLAVALGALFSGDKALRSAVINNIRNADQEIANEIEHQAKGNLIIALNGMRNFNLDAEVLRCVRLELERDGISDEVLKDLTKTYDVARYFISGNFNRCENEFEEASQKHGIDYTGIPLKNYIVDNIETDSRVLEIVNSVFMKVNGTSLRWDQGISAGAIISAVSQKLCGEGKPYNKVLLLFDEFGRYIEYVASNPVVAGDASLQQIFEAIQTAEGKAVFIGFIQYELETYLSHIEKTANIIRYVGRYSASEKYYLSSNFETILANLLVKPNKGRFDRVVVHSLDRYKNYHERIHNSLKRWNGTKQLKSVWNSDKIYRSTILEGCFPLHPLTVWVLSNSAGWMQQRSTISFCADMFDNVAQKVIEDDWLPYVYPVDIIDSGIYSEMLNSEDKGLVKSQNCLLYEEILTKIGDKLNEIEIKLLKAILITKIVGFSFADKEDAYTAYRYCCNLDEDEIKYAIKSLEDQHGVIAYDERTKTYDLIAEANGLNEFKRVLARYKAGAIHDVEDADEETLRDLNIFLAMDTSFGQECHISSAEWRFEKFFVNSSSITEPYINSRIAALNSATDGEKMRGALIYAYCADSSESEVLRLVKVAKKTGIDSVPIIILFLDDVDGDIIKGLTVKSTLKRFSVSDAERFSKHIQAQNRKQQKIIQQKFIELVMGRKMITEDGVCSYDMRLNALCTDKFKKVYTTPVPFVFDGFDNSKASQAKKTFATICIKMFDQTLMNIQSYQALSTADKNRIQSSISVGSDFSWQIFNDKCQLVAPQNHLISKISREVDQTIRDDETYTVNKLFAKYMQAPYGMNIYSITLFVVYYLQKRGNKLLCFSGKERLTSEVFSNSIFKDGKLKFSELQRITITKNPNADVDVLFDLCNEILENTDVNKCGIYRSQLEKAISYEGGAGKNHALVGQAKMRLDDGDKIRSNLKEKIDKINKFLDEATNKFIIHKFIGVFEYAGDPAGVIEEGLPFVYGQDFLDQMKTAKKRIDNLMGAPFYKALNALKCSDITQLGSFQNTYKRVVKALDDNGYKEQKLNTEERITRIVEETKSLNKYYQALADFEKDQALSGDISRINYDECMLRTTKFEGWIKFFSDAEMPAFLRDPLIHKAEEICRTVNERKKELLSKVTAAENKISMAVSSDDLLDVQKEMLKLSEYHFEKDVEDKIALIVKEINRTNTRIDNIPISIDEVETLLAGDLPYGTAYDRVYLNMLTRKCKDMKASELQWVEKVVVPAEDLKDVDAQQCTLLIDRLRVMPLYVSKKTTGRVHAAIANVEKKLHECKVQGVLSLYYSLSEDEKMEFLRLIKK